MNASTNVPDYERFAVMREGRSKMAASFAKQILSTVEPYLARETSELMVLDVGCGYGFTSRELARTCLDVVGLEPNGAMAGVASELAAEISNLTIVQGTLADQLLNERFDLIILDNVLEHIPGQRETLCQIAERLQPGGVVFLLIPNKLWPIEAHYRLPFLSYLPVPLANNYLRLSRRGVDYTDASYAPTYWQLNRLLRGVPELSFAYTLPADVNLATGSGRHYQLGVAMIRRLPQLWAISKSFLVVGRKHPSDAELHQLSSRLKT